MNLFDSVQKYLDDISSNSPTPGGGSVSAFSGAVACSLGIMVCNLTIGKKKYAGVEEEIKLLKQKLEEAKREFLLLAERDNDAFDKVMDAFKLPKETEDEKSARNIAIEKATFNAAVVPSQVLNKCKDVLYHIEKICDIGNQNSLSDAGVAASLIEAAARGAFLNVLINYSSLIDKTTAVDMFNSSESMLKNIEDSSGKILSGIKQRLNK